MDSNRRLNECPRCGHAYSSWNRPRSPQRSGVRLYSTAVALPWQCSCGVWLRVKPYSFNWVDLVALFALSLVSFFLASRFWWACNPFVFALPIGVWFNHRISAQFSIEEVPAPNEENREIA
jgi:hypothetical protein